MSTEQVQRWVATVLTVVLVGHLAEALVVLALVVPADVPSSAIGLLVLAAITGVLAVVGVRVIHHRRLLSAWLLLGLLPATVGALVRAWPSW